MWALIVVWQDIANNELNQVGYETGTKEEDVQIELEIGKRAAMVTVALVLALDKKLEADVVHKH